MRIGLADLVVQALLEMPEHKSLITDWPVVLKALGGVAEASSKSGKKESRIDVTKQRVLLQMLACAANAEVYARSKDDSLTVDADEDVLWVETQLEGTKEPQSKKSKGQTRDSDLAHEALSVALLKSLSGFLVSFKGDISVIKSLTALPRCLSKFVDNSRSFETNRFISQLFFSALCFEPSDLQN